MYVCVCVCMCEWCHVCEVVFLSLHSKRHYYDQTTFFSAKRQSFRQPIFTHRCPHNRLFNNFAVKFNSIWMSPTRFQWNYSELDFIHCFGCPLVNGPTFTLDPNRWQIFFCLSESRARTHDNDIDCIVVNDELYFCTRDKSQQINYLRQTLVCQCLFPVEVGIAIPIAIAKRRHNVQLGKWKWISIGNEIVCVPFANIANALIDQTATAANGNNWPSVHRYKAKPTSEFRCVDRNVPLANRLRVFQSTKRHVRFENFFLFCVSHFTIIIIINTINTIHRIGKTFSGKFHG